MHSQTSPPSFAANVLYHAETFFFRARDGNPPLIYDVEASERDALRLPETFTGSAEKEVFGRVGWDFFLREDFSYTPTIVQKTAVARPWPVEPGILATCNAFADGKDVYIYVQTWRHRDSSQVEQQVWTHTLEKPAGIPLILTTYMHGKIKLAWTKNSIRLGEEAQIVHLVRDERISEDRQSISEDRQSISEDGQSI